jgi:hypothetical protein
MIIVSISLRRVSLSIGERGYSTPFSMMLFICFQFGWFCNRGSRSLVGRNSAPYNSIVFCGCCVAASTSNLNSSSRCELKVAASTVLSNFHAASVSSLYSCVLIVLIVSVISNKFRFLLLVSIFSAYWCNDMSKFPVRE